MADDDLRALERAARSSPEDVSAWVRYVRALEREASEPPADLVTEVTRVRETLRRAPGSLADTRIRVGDEVWVEEKNNPWILGRWRGVVTAVRSFPDDRGRTFTQFRVRPIFPDESDPDHVPIPFRIQILPEQRVRGLELAAEDVVELSARRA